MTATDAGLREWAEGLPAHEAAVELLVGACNGALSDGPWVRTHDQGNTWFDPKVATAEAGYLGGGERRVLSIATSLVSDDHPVDLGDAIPGLDHDELRLVLNAFAHAGSAPSVYPGPCGDHHETC